MKAPRADAKASACRVRLLVLLNLLFDKSALKTPPGALP